MDSSSNNDDSRTPADAPVASSPAVERFLSCRWHKPTEEGIPAHCTHRDVLPMTGTTGFVPDAWCPDCAFYKAKRVAKKRPEEPPDSWRRW